MLCYFEGMTLDDAARRLHWPAGTLRSRLARAREKIRRGLTRRGIVLPAVALFGDLTPPSGRVSVPGSLCDATARAAARFVTGEAVPTSAAATALARDVLRSILSYRLIFTAVTLVVLGAIATSTGFVSHALEKKDEPKRPSSVQLSPLAAKQPDPNLHPAPGRMFVAGRVLDPQGKPVPNADVMVSATLRLSDSPILFGPSTSATNQHGHCDAAGRFRLDTSRTSSSRQGRVVVTAMAPGYGMGWVGIDPDAEQPDSEITLRPEEVIRGRMFDIHGRPV